FRVTKVQLGLLNGGFVSLNSGPARTGGSDRRISLLIADHLLIKQIERALFVRVTFDLVGLVFCQRRLGLRERCFERPRVDLEKEIAFVYYAAFFVIARNEVALHL